MFHIPMVVVVLAEMIAMVCGFETNLAFTPELYPISSWRSTFSQRCILSPAGDASSSKGVSYLQLEIHLLPKVYPFSSWRSVFSSSQRCILFPAGHASSPKGVSYLQLEIHLLPKGVSYRQLEIHLLPKVYLISSWRSIFFQRCILSPDGDPSSVKTERHLALQSGGWNKEDGNTLRRRMGTLWKGGWGHFEKEDGDTLKRRMGTLWKEGWGHFEKEDGDTLKRRMGTLWEAGPQSGCPESSCRWPVPQLGPKVMMMMMMCFVWK